MPATEQTWRSQKVMHVVFGVSALVMTVATVWMMAKDHNREWKTVQLADRKKEAWILNANHAALQDRFASKQSEFEEEKLKAETQPVARELIDQFAALVVAEDRRLAADADDPDALEDALPNDQNVASLEGQFLSLFAQREKLESAAAEVEQSASVGVEDEKSVDLVLKQAAAQKLRQELVAEMQTFVAEAQRREKRLVGEKKTINGMRTAVVSELGLMVHGDAQQEELDRTQRRIDGLDDQLRRLTAQIAAANDYRTQLEAVVNRVNAQRDALVKELASMETELNRVADLAYKNTSNWGEWITRLPVLNALYNGNVRIDQNWLPDLTINYNFSQVARFDRCATCHRAISKTAPGTATDPLYPTLPDDQRQFVVQIDAPEENPIVASERSATLRDVYGMQLSDAGIIEDEDVTVHYVLPDSAAARAGIQSGDVILNVGDAKVHTPGAVEDLLLTMRDGTKKAALTLLRGLDHPFTAHPRLDLFLTDLSPHPEKVMGCTICHDGQGSGTDFKWVSHTPNNASQQADWTQEYGWFDNHHWIFPMKPARFAESNCLKCHHQKGGLEPSEQFPEPPAPKLVEGWTIVERYGCFGCHDVNGYAGADRTIGPDVRLEPNYHEAAAQILADDGLDAHQRTLALRIVQMPSDAAARHELFAAIERDAELAADSDTSADARLTAVTHKVANVLKDVEAPGTYRKAGPSLRYLDAKVQYDWLYSWIRRPADFRESTKMPQFFGQWEHLSEPEDEQGLHESMRLEPIEIRALTTFLLKNSRSFAPLTAPAGVTEEASIDRGKWLFESRGCLACHSHSEFSGATQDQGPDLSRIAAKFKGEKGRRWLYSWLKEPHKYHPRTKMPDLYLEPIAEKDPLGKPTGKVTDPAADIAEFLLSVEVAWQPKDVPAPNIASMSDREQQALADLALQWLASDAIPRERAKRYLHDGIPEALSPRLKADERLLIGLNDQNRTERQLEFVARRTIGKYGCFGCHDIPGFEDAKPIGAALVDWGRKETSKLAFENIQAFLGKHGIKPANPTPTQAADALARTHASGADGADSPHAEHADEQTSPHAAHGHLDPGEFEPDESYFVQALNSHSRDGFLWQKLRYPRSYDYKTTVNKGFNERLRMPKFPFSDAEREAVMTFVLGLVNEPPADKYVYQPDERQQAIVDGRQVLERFNCGGCHTLKMEQWEFAYDDATFDSPSEVVDYPFLEPRFSTKEIADSQRTDARGRMHASVHGMALLSDETGQPFWVDADREPITPEELAEYEKEEGQEIPIFHIFTPWQTTLLNGVPRLQGVGDLLVPASREQYGPALGDAYPAWGGDLARYLFPRVVSRAKEINPQVNSKEAWGWLPPPLMQEGAKVQTDWLHAFLMDPTAIRPAAVMRMPNFHMSSDEAAKLVNYFAASSGVEFPYEYKPQQRASYLASLESHVQDPLAAAMQIVVNGNYCVKCHAVADFQPQGDANTFGPNLANVYRRLRPEYVRDWVANPARILPYTGMPVNIPFRPGEDHFGGVSQSLYEGDALEQLDGLVSLLMNFDTYAKKQTEVQALVEQASAAAQANPAAAP